MQYLKRLPPAVVEPGVIFFFLLDPFKLVAAAGVVFVGYAHLVGEWQDPSGIEHLYHQLDA